MSTLSADAAPVLLNDKINFYIADINEWIREDGLPQSYDEIDAYLNREKGDVEQLSWMRLYYLKIQELAEEMHVRNFNFSIYTARQYLW